MSWLNLNVFQSLLFTIKRIKRILPNKVKKKREYFSLNIVSNARKMT